MTIINPKFNCLLDFQGLITSFSQGSGHRVFTSLRFSPYCFPQTPDIDECTQFGGRPGRRGVCGGRCLNLPGSYRCECPDGWRLKPDGRSCQGRSLSQSISSSSTSSSSSSSLLLLCTVAAIIL